MPAEDVRRHVPRTDAVLANPRVAEAVAWLGIDVVKRVVHSVQDRARIGEIAVDAVIDTVLADLPATASSLRPVINATGIVLHTNLGRAPLSPAAVAALVAAAGYVDVEFDLPTATRSQRGRGTLDALLARVPAAEAALVVNNGAGALVLAATALAQGREIVISRGELVEIGDGFRLPELLESTGARLREVGTTNRTHLDDYAEAIGDHTGFVLKVHPSNFAMHGFTRSVEVRELASLGVPVVADIGSGLLEPMPGLPDEPDACTWLTAGATIVTASADKLLGGPQAGIVLGAAPTVQALRRHPLHRALRADKLTLAALEATVRGPAPPARQALAADPETLHTRASTLANALREREVPAQVVPSDGLVGGGGAPDTTLKGWAVAVPAVFAVALRTGRPSVVARVAHGSCLIDPRCVPPHDDEIVLAAILAAAEPCT